MGRLGAFMTSFASFRKIDAIVTINGDVSGPRSSDDGRRKHPRHPRNIEVSLSLIVVSLSIFSAAPARSTSLLCRWDIDPANDFTVEFNAANQSVIATSHPNKPVSTSWDKSYNIGSSRDERFDDDTIEFKQIFPDAEGGYEWREFSINRLTGNMDVYDPKNSNKADRGHSEYMCTKSTQQF
ncbi:MAG: hypothetical protein ACREEX_01285 [Caulobacteraceae bacterium]